MATVKISELPAAGALAGTEEVPVVQTAATVKTTVQDVVDMAVNIVVNGAPASLDDLNKIAAAINDDPAFYSTVTTALALKADLASPGLTGNPTAPTQSSGDNSTKIATTAFVKAAVDAVSGGLYWKAPVRVATTAAGMLATDYEDGDTIDGVVLSTGDRILIKDQGTASENGIYTVNASGAPTRAADADSGDELVNASFYVSEGTTYADTQWTCTNNAPITVGVTSLTFVQFSSGGGLANWTDALNTSAPNATVPVSSLTATDAASNVDAAIVPKGTGALLADVPDNTSTGGNKRGAQSVDLQMARSAASQVASGIRAAIIAGTGNTASGTDSAVLGGSNNTASQQENVVIGGQSNTCAGSYRNTVLGGYGNSISDSYENVAGGNGNVISASGGYNFAIGYGNTVSSTASASAAIGQQNTVSGLRSFAIGQSNSVSGAGAGAIGYGNTMDAQYSYAIGVNNYARGRKGILIFGPGVGGFDDTNTVFMNLVGTTTDGTTAVKLTSDGAAAAATNQLSMTSGASQMMTFSIIVIATNSAGTAGAGFEIKGVARGPTMALIGTPVVTSLGADAALATVTMDVVTDSTNSAISIRATGVAATTIRWNASVRAAYIR